MVSPDIILFSSLSVVVSSYIENRAIGVLISVVVCGPECHMKVVCGTRNA